MGSLFRILKIWARIGVSLFGIWLVVWGGGFGNAKFMDFRIPRTRARLLGGVSFGFEWGVAIAKFIGFSSPRTRARISGGLIMDLDGGSAM